MTVPAPPPPAGPSKAMLGGVALVSAALLMTELALTRIFSVTMFYHFAFLAISIGLFGLSVSGVYVYIARSRSGHTNAGGSLPMWALAHALLTVVSLAFLVRLRVGLNYSTGNLLLMLTIYLLAALPFFAGGTVLSLAVTRFAHRIELVYAADLAGAAAGCFLLVPLLDRIGAPGVVLAAAACTATAAVLLASAHARARAGWLAAGIVGVPIAGHLVGGISFDVSDTKGHRGDRILFSKWNSFSRVAVYERPHGDWSLSERYVGPRPETRFMDIDSAASTPILRLDGNVSKASYLRYELTALAYHLKAPQSNSPLPLMAEDWSNGHNGGGLRKPAQDSTGFRALIIGPGGGRDLLAALVFGAGSIDAVEINPIIANDVMRGRFKDFSGGIYEHPRVQVFVEDGRSFVRRSRERYDIIQASLVDTWAATAAGAYALTENTLYTVEAFEDYLDHLTDGGVMTISRWAFDGLRLVALAQEACARRGCSVGDRLAVVRHDQVISFLFKKTPFTHVETAQLARISADLGFAPLYIPGRVMAADDELGGDYPRLIQAADRQMFYEKYPQDIRPTSDDRPFFFHTTKLEDQFEVAFGRSMLFGNGLSALLTLMGISLALVVLLVVGPLALTGGRDLSDGGVAWLLYFGALGAGFMLVEVSLLQRFVLLLGHPVYSLTVTLCSLLLGTGLGSAASRRLPDAHLRRSLFLVLALIVAIGGCAGFALAPLIQHSIVAGRASRILIAAAFTLPVGLFLGIPLPAGMRLLSTERQTLVPWAWGINGALSVVGATVAVFIAMNWGFSASLLGGAAFYAAAGALLLTRRQRPGTRN